MVKRADLGAWWFSGCLNLHRSRAFCVLGCLSGGWCVLFGFAGCQAAVGSRSAGWRVGCIALGCWGCLRQPETESFNGVRTEKLPDVLQGLPDLLGFLRQRVGLVCTEDALQILLGV